MRTSIPRRKAVVLCSGGLASSTVAFLLGIEDRGLPRGSVDELPSSLRQARGLTPESYDLHLLTVQDGQRPRKQELGAARLMAGILDASYEVLDPSALTPLPSLVAAAPHARMFALAGVVAVREGAEVIAAGMYSGDRPDASEEWPAFVAGFNQVAQHASAVPALPCLRLIAPLAGLGLSGLISLGQQLGVPLAQTWSCVESFALQCGRCEPCLARQTAFGLAGVRDQTRYGDPPGVHAVKAGISRDF